jgi:hypothetical protein
MQNRTTNREKVEEIAAQQKKWLSHARKILFSSH